MNLLLAVLTLLGMVFGVYCAVLVLVKFIEMITRGY